MKLRLSPKAAVLLAAAAILLAAAVPAKTRLARHLFQRGQQARDAGQLERAVQRFDLALRLKEDLAEAWLEKAVCLNIQGDFLEARKALDVLGRSDLGPTEFKARYLLVQGSVLSRSGEAEAALESFEECASIARSLGDVLLEARALLEMSYVYQYSLNREGEALDLLERVLRISRERGAEVFEAEALVEIGQIRWWFRREIGEPLTEYYLPALDIYRKNRLFDMVSHTLPKLAQFHLADGNLFEYFRYSHEALELREELGHLAGVSESHRQLGWAHIWLGNHRKAHQHLERSLELSRRTGDRFGRRRAAWYLASSYLDLGMNEEAVELLEENRDPDDMIFWEYLGRALLGRGELAEARRHFEKTLAMEQESGGRYRGLRLLGLEGLAESYLLAGELERASEVLSRAGELLHSPEDRQRSRERPVDDWTSLLAYKQVQADLLEKQGHPEKALAHLAEAAAIANRTFRTAPAPLVWAGQDPLFDRLFAALLESGAAEEVFSFLEERRYRTLRDLVAPWGDSRRGSPEASSAALERIRQASRELGERQDPSAVSALRQAYGDYEDEVLRETLSDSRYRLVRRARPVELSSVRSRLAPATALLVYVLAGEKVWALVLTRSAFDAVELPVHRERLVPKVKLLRRLLFGAESSDWKPVARDLRRVLIEPVEQKGLLDRAERLGLIPYGLLHDVPFAALLGPGEEPRFLVEDYSLFLTPSASFLTAGSGEPAAEGMLAFGLGEAAEGGLAPLAFAEAEAEAVAEVYGGEVRTGAAATEEELARLASRFRVLHLAAHGVAEPEMPLLSRLLLGEGGGEDGSLSVREIFELHLSADLVTLSGCNTGLTFPASGRRVSDAGRMGFIEAFLHAGASSVLASLLPVSDRPTTELMRTFYTHLRTKDKAAALAETQRAMLRGEVSYELDGEVRRLDHPRYWAPFVLVGKDR